MGEVFVTNFTAIDWVIVAIYLMLSVLVGIWVNRYIHNVTDYLVGGRASRTSLNVATYIGTGLGLVTLMYASIDAFSNGFAYVTLALMGFVVGVILGATGLVIGPLREMKLLTIPEFFERRYGPRTRIVAGSICALAGILNMGLFPKLGATFITYVTGLSEGSGSHELTINVVTSLLIVAVLLYTVIGGMVSVMLTDYLQFVVLSIGMGLGVYFCLIHPDLGWNNMVGTLAEHRGEGMFNPIVNENYGWIWVCFNFVVLFVASFCWAPEATRALTARDVATTRRTFLVGAPGQFIRLGVPALWAVAAFCLVAASPALTEHFFPFGLDGEARHASQAMPLVIGKIVPSGLLGLLVAGLLAAFMSTHDSYLLCWASVIARDVVNPLTGGALGGQAQIRVTRIGVVLIGVFLLVWGVWYELPDSVWNYMAVTGTIYLSGAGVALLGGIYWKRASTVGALAAFTGGLVSIIGLFTEQINERLENMGSGFEITSPMLGLFNYIFCAVLFIAFSLLFPDRRHASSRVPAK